jgi:hypothetical protein
MIGRHAHSVREARREARNDTVRCHGNHEGFRARLAASLTGNHDGTPRQAAGPPGRVPSGGSAEIFAGGAACLTRPGARFAGLSGLDLSASGQGAPFIVFEVKITTDLRAIPLILQMPLLNRNSHHVRPERSDAPAAIVANARV